MIDREIRDARNKAIDDAVASMDNRMRHLFNQGFELGRKMAEKEESRIKKEMLTDDVRENVHGEWYYTVNYGDRYRVCSKCKAGWKDGNLSDWNFCPDCGADMRKEV